MLFNSVSFLIFFPIVTTIYFLLPQKFRWIHLLTSSCFFYMLFIPAYIIILFITISIDYLAGIYIERSEGKKRKYFLIISIVSTCLVLFFFKYFNFFNDNFRAIAGFLHLNYPIPILNIILPIGLSFHTFQSLSYVIEVYRGNQKTEKHFGIYALYVMFYPQLVAGPIERPQNLLHQFYEKHKFDYERVIDGLKLMLWGFFKKIVIADRLAIVVNQIYNDPHQYEGVQLIVATIFFAFQIYCDFSGYSDIAIGSAKVMGFNLMINFRKPYFSQSVSEFWKKWHISLTTWFRDYLFFPLSFAISWRIRKERVLTIKSDLFIYIVASAITWFITGLWHGANWTFVIWGGLNGFFLVLESLLYKNSNDPNILIKSRYQVKKLFKIVITFCLISVGWVFFRAANLNDSFYILTHLFSGIKDFILNISDLGYISGVLSSFGVNRFEFFLSFFFIGFLILTELINYDLSFFERIKAFPVYFRWIVYYFVIGILVFFGTFNSTQQFIYFQF
jgi:alginate O-acetyltransferase complex protein AlgI